MDIDNLPDLLTPGEVAQLFRVDPKTVTRWGSQIDPRTGKPKLQSVRTPGGHRRYPKDVIKAAYKRS